MLFLKDRTKYRGTPSPSASLAASNPHHASGYHPSQHSRQPEHVHGSKSCCRNLAAVRSIPWRRSPPFSCVAEPHTISDGDASRRSCCSAKKPTQSASSASRSSRRYKSPERSMLALIDSLAVAHFVSQSSSEGACAPQNRSRLGSVRNAARMARCSFIWRTADRRASCLLASSSASGHGGGASFAPVIVAKSHLTLLSVLRGRTVRVFSQNSRTAGPDMKIVRRTASADC